MWLNLKDFMLAIYLPPITKANVSPDKLWAFGKTILMDHFLFSKSDYLLFLYNSFVC